MSSLDSHLIQFNSHSPVHVEINLRSVGDNDEADTEETEIVDNNEVLDMMPVTLVTSDCVTDDKLPMVRGLLNTTH